MQHSPLEHVMFWTGALIALMPVLLGLIVLGVVLYNKRRQRQGGTRESS